MNAIILVSIVALLIISLLIGLYASRKANSVTGFLGATKSFGPVVTGLSGMSAIASGMVLVGIPAYTYSTGNTMLTWCALAPCLAVAYVYIGKKIRALAEVREIATMGDLVDARYNNNKVIKGCMAFVMFLGCFAYLAAQIAAGATLLTFMFGWSPLTAGLVTFGVVIIYVAVGGERAGIMSQAFQGFIMVIAGIIIWAFFFFKLGGFGAMNHAVGAGISITGTDGTTATFVPKMLGAFGKQGPAMAMAYFTLSYVGTVCQPSTLTRMYAMKDPRQFPRAGLVSGITHAIVAFTGFIVGYCVITMVATGMLEPLANPNDSVWKLGEYMGPAVQVIIYVAVMAAVISSSSTFLSVASSSLSRDLLSCFLKEKLPEKKQMAVSRAAIVLVGICALLFASFSKQGITLIGALGWGTMVSATLPVLVIGVSWKKANAKGMMAASISAVILNIAGMIAASNSNIKWPQGLAWYFYVIVVAVVLGVVVSYFTYDEKKDRLERNVDIAISM